MVKGQNESNQYIDADVLAKAMSKNFVRQGGLSNAFTKKVNEKGEVSYFYNKDSPLIDAFMNRLWPEATSNSARESFKRGIDRLVGFDESQERITSKKFKPGDSGWPIHSEKIVHSHLFGAITTDEYVNRVYTLDEAYKHFEEIKAREVAEGIAEGYKKEFESFYSGVDSPLATQMIYDSVRNRVADVANTACTDANIQLTKYGTYKAGIQTMLDGREAARKAKYDEVRANWAIRMPNHPHAHDNAAHSAHRAEMYYVDTLPREKLEEFHGVRRMMADVRAPRPDVDKLVPIIENFTKKYEENRKTVKLLANSSLPPEEKQRHIKVMNNDLFNIVHEAHVAISAAEFRNPANPDIPTWKHICYYGANTAMYTAMFLPVVRIGGTIVNGVRNTSMLTRSFYLAETEAAAAIALNSGLSASVRNAAALTTIRTGTISAAAGVVEATTAGMEIAITRIAATNSAKNIMAAAQAAHWPATGVFAADYLTMKYSEKNHGLIESLIYSDAELNPFDLSPEAYWKDKDAGYQQVLDSEKGKNTYFDRAKQIRNDAQADEFRNRLLNPPEAEKQAEPVKQTEPTKQAEPEKIPVEVKKVPEATFKFKMEEEFPDAKPQDPTKMKPAGNATQPATPPRR